MPYREQIPVDQGLDNSFALLMEGYQYITNRRYRFQSDIFETRLLGGQKAICIAGEDAARVFYDNEKFMRKGAAPMRVRQTIFGEHSIQTMDGAAHEHRKKLFMGLMTPDRLHDFKLIAREQWEFALDRWEKKEKVVLYEEATYLLTRVACAWAGVPLKEKELELRAKELEALFDSAAAIGPRHWKGRMSRNKAERWVGNLVEDVRNKKLQTQEGTALHEISWHRYLNGNLLDPHMAAVEVINILRPIVAIVVYITFCALALHDHPGEKEKLKSGDNEYIQMFVQEVRRFYPFFPFATARVREDFLWKGHDFKKGNLVLLDIYGTTHHPDLWDKPSNFNPERFKDWEGGLFDLIPQGGGDYVKDHRCPGEWLTIEMMKIAVDMLVNKMEYRIPNQNLHFSLVRMPSLPNSRFVMTDIRIKNN